MARVEDLLFDYLPLTENALKGEPAIAFAAEPEAVSSAMENIQAAGLNPDTILPDSLGLIAVGKYLFQGDPPHRSRLILDLGASQTGMALFHQGRAITSRTVPFGGLNLTQALAEAQNRDMSEAEALKRKTGLGDKETSEAAAILREAWQLLIAEIERTLAASLTDPDEPAPRTRSPGSQPGSGYHQPASRSGAGTGNHGRPGHTGDHSQDKAQPSPGRACPTAGPGTPPETPDPDGLRVVVDRSYQFGLPCFRLPPSKPSL